MNNDEDMRPFCDGCKNKATIHVTAVTNVNGAGSSFTCGISWLTNRRAN